MDRGLSTQSWPQPYPSLACNLCSLDDLHCLRHGARKGLNTALCLEAILTMKLIPYKGSIFLPPSSRNIYRVHMRAGLPCFLSNLSRSDGQADSPIPNGEVSQSLVHPKEPKDIGVGLHRDFRRSENPKKQDLRLQYSVLLNPTKGTISVSTCSFPVTTLFSCAANGKGKYAIILGISDSAA